MMLSLWVIVGVWIALNVATILLLYVLSRKP